jgi:hypothetical protein
MNLLKRLLAVAIATVSMLSLDARAGFDVDWPEIAMLSKVAVVSVSFRRDNSQELTPDDPEYIMMQEAGDRVLGIIAKGAAFSIVPPEDVVANPEYVKRTSELSRFEKWNLYFPQGYRKIKLIKSRDDAMALCEALGVDAVVQVYFSGYEKSSGMMFKTNKSQVMTGEVTMIDGNGKVLISGKAKSDPEGTSTSWGNGSFEVEVPSDGSANMHQSMLASYLVALQKEMKL